MSDDRRTFNLQLTIQKLEEELQLYKNGTNNITDLLELIDEKDLEIMSLRKSNNDIGDKLNKLSQASQDLVKKYDQLQKDHHHLKTEYDTALIKIDDINHTNNNLAQKILQLQNESESLLADKLDLHDDIKLLNSRLDDANEDICKLQSKDAESVKSTKALKATLDNTTSEYNKLNVSDRFNLSYSR